MITASNHNELVTEGLRQVYFDELEALPSLLSSFFNIQSSDKAVEYTLGMGDIGQPVEFNGKVYYGNIYQQYKNTFTPTTLVLGIQIQREIKDDDLYNTVMSYPGLLALAMRRKRNMDGGQLFNDADSSGVLLGDGKSLCDTAHPAKGISTTFGNKGTSSMDKDTISATRLLMKKYRSSSNEKIGIRPDLLAAGIDLEDTMAELIKTPLEPWNADNTINVNQNRFKYIAWEEIDDSDEWFMIDSGLMKKYVHWFDRTNVEFNEDADSDTYVSKYSSYMRYSYGADEFRWLYGQFPA